MAPADKFRALSKKLQQEVAQAAVEALNDEADRLVTLMKSVAPEGETGKLKESIRKEPGANVLQVKIKAGGKLTTKEVRKGSGVAYDYARADEFGTEHAPAKPFFFPTFRLRKKAIRTSVRKQITKAIKARSAE
jgi:HK97 gp10 family phage protein